MDLNEISVFVKVVQTAGFARAARALGMPKSTVSARIAGLEQRLGVTLLSRTTRSLHVTQAGEVFFRECSQALQTLQNAELAITQEQTTPMGLLRVTAPQDFAAWILPDLSRRFSSEFSKVELDWVFTDRMLDLLNDGIDVAIRAGTLADSSLVGRRVGQTNFGLFASADYLADKPPLAHPRDLQAHACLRFSAPSLRTWELMRETETCSISVRGPVQANSVALIKQLTLDGQGVALLPVFLCQAAVNQGVLVQVLPQWRTPGSPVHLLYPAQKFVPPKLRMFLDVADNVLKGALAC